MKSEIDIEVIGNVKKLRDKLNISQRTLAEIIGVSQAFVGQVESSKYPTRYSVRHIYLIAKYFGCAISDIYPPIDPLEP